MDICASFSLSGDGVFAFCASGHPGAASTQRGLGSDFWLGEGVAAVNLLPGSAFGQDSSFRAVIALASLDGRREVFRAMLPGDGHHAGDWANARPRRSTPGKATPILQATAGGPPPRRREFHRRDF